MMDQTHKLSEAQTKLMAAPILTRVTEQVRLILHWGFSEVDLLDGRQERRLAAT